MKALKLFNVRTQRLEDFKPTEPYDVKIYCCGPNVNDEPHLGHARTYVFLDILCRILRNYLGFGVRSVIKIADLNHNKVDFQSARQCEKSFFEMMFKLNVEIPDFPSRVSNFIEKAEHVYKKCLVNQLAYFSSGFLSTVFSMDQYLKEFDCVFPHSIKQVVEKNGKWDVRDFVIWRNLKEWTDVEGKKQIGLPNRHTECATIASFFFPDSLDIHVGDTDLQHYENEISLGRAFLDNKDWVQFCLYTGRIETNLTRNINHIIEEGYSPLALRYMFLKFPYDKPINFHKEDIEKAQKSYDNFMYHIQLIKLRLIKLKPKSIEKDFNNYWYDDYGLRMELSQLTQVKKEINAYLMDNLNVGGALKVLEEYVQDFSHFMKQDLSYDWLLYCFKFIMYMTDTCFGLIDQSKREELLKL